MPTSSERKLPPYPLLRYDVNLSILFSEEPLLRRPKLVTACGFDAVELWWPFDTPVPGDRQVDALVRALEEAGVSLVGLNFDAGDMASGDRGLVSDPDRADRFRANIDVAVGIAGRTGCRVLNALYGNRVKGVDVARQDELATENLVLAARAADRVGATVVVEALNAHENPRYPVTTARAALAVIDRATAAGGTRVAFLCDLYHLGRMGEDLPAIISDHWRRFGHVQLADVPGRHQPGTGELDVPGLLAALAATGYAGYVGLEYQPAGPSADSFSWLDPPLRSSRRAAHALEPHGGEEVR